MEQLKILLIGNGAREHALVCKLDTSPRVDAIYVVPGNGGTASGLSGKIQNIDYIKADDFSALISFAKERDVNLVVPGPEAPLVAGISDACQAAGLRCFGPSKAAARMEGSKAFAKEFMTKHRIPTAEYRSFNDYGKAKTYLESVTHSVVLKASGLAAGKGVIIPSSTAEAQQALRQMMVSREFGEAGNEVVIEEYLEGEELSIISFCDGYTIRSLPPAQDHKQVHDGDQGPMTGGMGCYAPTMIATPALMDQIETTILQPTMEGMRRDRNPFVGILFTGLMITRSGAKVLEYNVRSGDPETQTLIPLLSKDTDLAEIMVACTDHYLDSVTIKVDPKFSATVVIAAGGYPGPYVRGDEIELQKLPSELASCSAIYHAGTMLDANKLKTSGGRVLAASATGSDLRKALDSAYAAISTISFSNMYYRKDIGHRALYPKIQAQSSELPSNGPLTYSSAGVSISSGNDLVTSIKPMVASTARLGTSATIGGFGGVFDLSSAGYKQPPLIIGATDGVGTKLNVAHAMDKHDTVGIDLVAMSVNDLVVQGAEPLFFLDCYTCGKLEVEVAKSFVQGVVKGCIESGCALIGGETAEMPGLFKDNPGIYDATGSAVGAIEQGKRILPDKVAMVEGDVLLGLASDGCHSNGFSLIRKIVERANLSYDDPAPWDSEDTVGIGLLKPTRIYVKPLLRVVAQDLVKGMSHITGGGLVENVPRMLPKHLAAQIDVSSWEVPKVLQWLKKTGGLEDLEFARTFNTGLGMVLVVEKRNVEKVVKELEAAGEKVFEIGELVQRGSEACILKRLESWAKLGA